MEVGRRNKLDITAVVVDKKIIIVGVIIFSLVVAAIGAAFVLTRKKETVQTGLTKNTANSESLQAKTSTNSSLAAMKQSIIDKENAAKRAKEKKDAEYEKLRLAKVKQEQESQSNAGQNAPADSRQAQTFRADNRQDSSDKNAPLPKAQRILTGETLVKIDKTDEGGSTEKDYLQSGEYADGVARIVTKRRYLLSAGTSLSCLLKTKIITSYPAITLCQMARDVYSDDGKTLLVRKGALLTGEQKKAITQGVARVFVNWTDIKDGNVTVRVDGLGTDSLGAAGLPAWIDSHFFERFGNSLLLSLVGDTMDSVKNMTQRNSGNQGAITYDNTSDASQQQAAIALQNSINIASTGYINQGTVISIIVPRNIDFSSVYEVN
ncbi:TraI protein (plasmid) [Erwinia tasmaniensis Et1/99]|uniref:TraI protein n=1 Tax=Erwinia tasmaniensis (strain DSM 17950 / CFBP 7177 / CIP 109463 / NCPPB 4357 / Et1/99) TaxID=465817 RepID=B2VAV3_ERWT9|nr:TraI protein [Erwinia tasmaniensis Et1/99]